VTSQELVALPLGVQQLLWVLTSQLFQQLLQPGQQWGEILVRFLLLLSAAVTVAATASYCSG